MQQVSLTDKAPLILASVPKESVRFRKRHPFKTSVEVYSQPHKQIQKIRRLKNKQRRKSR